jgi:uncharacterized lipoprotein YajG
VKRSRRSARLGGLMCVLLVAGCASSKPSMSASASATLVQQAASVRAAVTNNDLPGAHAQLARLRRTVADLEAKGQLSASRAAAILTSAAEVDTLLGPGATTTNLTTTTTSVTTPPPAKGKGNGKGHSGD